jgi:pyruvate formate lyase activating enzyme
MKIGGFQEISLLDYPDTISAIIWTIGCNFRCPYCYNKQLVLNEIKNISEDKIFNFLEERKGKIEGVTITGGEPLLQKDIEIFIKKVKTLGYLVKIDTNGSFPKKLDKLINENLVDYIAMDIKAPKNKYNMLSGINTNIKKIEESVKIVRNKSDYYEFRTTIIPRFLEKNDIIEIAEWLRGAKKFYLQQFKSNPPLLSNDFEKVEPYLKEELNDILNTIKPYFEKCFLRGV